MGEDYASLSPLHTQLHAVKKRVQRDSGPGSGLGWDGIAHRGGLHSKPCITHALKLMVSCADQFINEVTKFNPNVVLCLHLGGRRAKLRVQPKSKGSKNFKKALDLNTWCWVFQI